MNGKFPIRGLRYVAIGGHAVNLDCAPRTTLDVDLLVPRSELPAWRAVIKAEGFRLPHALRHGPPEREAKDLGDIIGLMAAGKLPLVSPAMTEMLARHGTPEIHDRLAQQFVRRGGGGP